tara:strand:- start:7351 stop:7551 length:201 start_codon:yes stop_codon:yes gene_type:complete
MKRKKTKDLRPALAFDNRKEVRLILDALNAYRIHHIDLHIYPYLEEELKSLCDEIEKVEQMFNKKG